MAEHSIEPILEPPGKRFWKDTSWRSRIFQVFRVLRYDNLTSAVKRFCVDFAEKRTERFIAFRSHWKFQAEFCTRGWRCEGGVEGRRIFPPEPLCAVPCAEIWLI